MNITPRERVVFRCYENHDPQWEAYGIDNAAYGSGNTLTEASDDFREALSLLLDKDCSSRQFEQYHEHLIRKADDFYPEVWVRTFQDDAPEKILERRRIAEAIEKTLQVHPEYMGTFSNGVASTGDIIAFVALPDDRLSDIVGQVGDSDRIYVCLEQEGKLLWQTLSTQAADSDPDCCLLSQLHLEDKASATQFMRETQATDYSARDFLIPA